MIRYYADVHRRARNGEGLRITYTTDGVTFRNADSFADIPAEHGDRVFVDTLPVQHTDGAIELLRRGVEVYYLRRLTLLKKVREENKLPKSTRGDIKALMNIEERWFRRASADFLIMRRMILTYRTMMKTRQQLFNKYKALSESERNVLKPAIKSLEGQMDEVARMIVEETGKRYPAYNILIRELGISDSLAGREALAELLVYADFVDSPLRGLKKLMGLYKSIRSSKREHWRLYDGKLHQAASRLAIAYYRMTPNGRQCWELVKQIKQLVTAQTPG